MLSSVLAAMGPGHLHAFQAGDLAVPYEGRAERVQSGQNRLDDLGTIPSPGMRVAGMAVASALLTVEGWN